MELQLVGCVNLVDGLVRANYSYSCMYRQIYRYVCICVCVCVGVCQCVCMYIYIYI